jgi:hypothetical protein
MFELNEIYFTNNFNPERAPAERLTQAFWRESAETLSRFF